MAQTDTIDIPTSFEASAATEAPVGREAISLSPASFRDPSGFIFRNSAGEVLRQVNSVYQAEYSQLMDGGLYDDLTSNRLLVGHEELSLAAKATEEAYCVIRPQPIEFISYPYEWSFSQLKDAALLTLEIQERAMRHGMSLKDASAFNVQFDQGRPIFIDTLSFEKYTPGNAWVAYGQFCRHFLAPLALMAYADVRLGRLLAQFIDGVPLDLAAQMLPWRARFRSGLLMHLFLHARSRSRHEETSGDAPQTKPRDIRVSPLAMRGLIDSLRRTIESLKYRAAGTEWADYYDDHSYSSESHDRKRQAVADYINHVSPETVWDLGANTGLFSRLAAETGAATVAFDVDPACVERNYLACRKQKEQRLLPLCLDLTNPSAGIGWANNERDSLSGRGPADLVMALALIHHLSISNNVPLPHVARYFGELADHLIIEFVPKGDPQVQRLLRSREDIFVDYTQTAFEAAFGRFFEIVDSQDMENCGRMLYLMKAR